MSSGGEDCDDTEATIHPDAVDTVGDDIDNNCDGSDGVDVDGDLRATLANASSAELLGAALFQSLVKQDEREVLSTCWLDERELEHLAAAKLDFQGYADFCSAR
jgi:hypothetical protein